MNYNFEYLSSTFKDWYEQKSQEHGKDFILPENPIQYLLSEHEELYVNLGMTQNIFEKIFLEPYYALIEADCFNFENMSEITEIISKVIGKATIIQKKLPLEPFSINIEKSRDRYARALDWTCMQMRELRLTGLEIPNIATDSEEGPILQCLYCGELNADKKGRTFNKKRRYCHDKNCTETKSVNPEHHPDCCYGDWAKGKKLLRQALKRHYKGREKGISYFKIFCNDLYDHALTISEPIRTSAMVSYEFLKAIGLKDEDIRKVIDLVEPKDSFTLMKGLQKKVKL